MVDRARRDALDVSFLDDGGQRLLRHSTRFQEAGEVGAFPELRDLEFDRPGSGLPHPVSVAIAMVDALGRALPVLGTGQSLNLELHQALGSEADHLTQQIRVRALLK